MRLEVARGGTLNADTTDRCVVDDGTEDLTLDLRHTEFIEPYGLVTLACMVGEAKERGQVVHALAPERIGAGNYMARMGFGSLLEAATGSNPLPSVGARPAGDRLVELRRVTPGEGVDQLPEFVKGRVTDMMGAPPVEPLYWALYELCLNVEEHSGTIGFLAAQVWGGSGYVKTIGFAIGDWGVGIPTSLAAAGHSFEDPADAIVGAAQSRLSRKGQNGGFGLPTNVREAIRLNGSVRIRSGGCCVSVSGAGVRRG